MNLVLFAAVSYPWWAKIGAPLANHLWQSTLFAAMAGLVTLFLAKNHASTRYSIWLIASLKFLIPFSLLMTVGSQFHWARSASAAPIEGFAVMESFNEPFAAVNSASPIVSGKTAVQALVTHMLPMMLLVVWGAGFVSVIAYWWLRMRGIRVVARNAKSVEQGREFGALCRARRAAGECQEIRLALSDSSLEPGIFGVVHPVLILPAGICERLTDAQLEAVMVHELCHVCRRDNLAAALHMLVEAVFWFHPLVWWLGARLVDERERACDEEVLRLGIDPQSYSESILKICEFYVESLLLCASGVTGSSLKKRIEVIMRNRAPLNLNFARKLLLGSAGFVVVAIPLIFGLLHATQTDAKSPGSTSIKGAFDSVYLQPNTTGEPMPPFKVYGRPMKAVQLKDGTNFLATNFSLRDLIRVAFQVQGQQIVSGPDWLDSGKYDIDAKVTGAEAERIQHLNPQEKTEQLRARLQVLLADRFKLAVHRATETVPVYALVLAQNGPQLHPAKPGDMYNDGLKDHAGRPVGPGTLLFPESNKLVAQAIPVQSLTDWLARQELDRVVVEKTGLTDKYDITLRLPAKQTNYWSVTALTEALEQQIGLKLEAEEDPAEVLVIDHTEEPLEIASPAEASESPFESVSIRLDRDAPGMFSFGWFAPAVFSTKGATLDQLMLEAYGLQSQQIVGAPGWANSDRYDIKAKLTESEVDKVKKLDEDSSARECMHQLQQLLSERFKLVVHQETRLVPAYVLRVTASGPKLHPGTPGDTYPTGLKDMYGKGHAGIMHFDFHKGKLIFQGVSVSKLVKVLATGTPWHMDRIIVDNTGLTGTYDFAVEWTPTSTAGTPDPALVRAMEDQLGLTLEAKDAVVPVVVVDHAGQPSLD